MPIGTDEIRHLAGLAQLELEESAIEELRGQLDTILQHVAMLRELELAQAPEDPGASSPDLREDRVRPGLETEQALENAPEAEAALFRVPRVLDR